MRPADPSSSLPCFYGIPLSTTYERSTRDVVVPLAKSIPSAHFMQIAARPQALYLRPRGCAAPVLPSFLAFLEQFSYFFRLFNSWRLRACRSYLALFAIVLGFLEKLCYAVWTSRISTNGCLSSACPLKLLVPCAPPSSSLI